MIKASIKAFLLFSTLLSLNAHAQNIIIQLPDNPQFQDIPKAWKGYNEGANSNVFEIQTADFSNAFSNLGAGIIRWPGGNSGNNYRWQEHLTDDFKLNLKNLTSFLDTFDVDVQIVVNFGNGSAAAAAEFVHVCNNSNAYYTHLRDSLLAHPDPIGVKYWEIGNESTDAWSFGWSWLGFQEQIRFQSGDPNHTFTRVEADSLYYYGGSFFREGWVTAIGGLDNSTAVLGDLKFYTAPLTSDVIEVEYPLLDIMNQDAVRVYRTPGFDFTWAQNEASQQQLYDSITKPANLLPPDQFTWTDTEVTINPGGGISSNDLILIEYNSIGHDGAFAFRDSMKTADPSIEIGYTVKPKDEQAFNPVFQQDFANSPPDFMIEHPYASGLTIPSVQQGLFSEAAYVSEKKIAAFSQFSRLWEQRKQDWDIPNEIGLAVTEWNIALYDEAPDDHPIRGITCGLYIADFWARTFQYALNDSFDLRTLNHFALAAQGNNFIHLFHTNPAFSLSIEGQATTMVMEALGNGIFPISADNNPPIDVLTNNGQNLDTVTVDAIQVWGGIGNDEGFINLLLINRDDENEHTADIQIPATWNADSIFVGSLNGTMTNEMVFYNFTKHMITGESHSIDLPAFSVSTIGIRLSDPISSTGQHIDFSNGMVYPNPGTSFVFLDSPEPPSALVIYDNSGKNVTDLVKISSNLIGIDQLPAGAYYILASFSGQQKTYRFVKT